MASPLLAKAVLMAMVVILKEPLCVVGLPAYIYCTLLALVTLREALRSILKSRTGSRVILSCRSSVRLVVAGVATLSLERSHPLSRAFSI